MLKDKFGIEMKDFYADKSTRKNEEIRAYLENGDESLIKEELNFANEIFHNAIKKNLGIKDDSPVLSGAMYHAKEAIEMGLAHEIGDFNKAVEYAFKLGMKNAMKPFLNK
jgi:ClpP class serine protease